jgi:hypothetical protein
VGWITMGALSTQISNIDKNDGNISFGYSYLKKKD